MMQWIDFCLCLFIFHPHDGEVHAFSLSPLPRMTSSHLLSTRLLRPISTQLQDNTSSSSSSSSSSADSTTFDSSAIPVTPPIPAPSPPNECYAPPRQVVTLQLQPMQTVLHTFHTQQPPTFSSQISHTLPIAVIDKSQYDEWKTMVEENVRLKERISLLEGEYTKRLTKIDVEIDQLQGALKTLTAPCSWPISTSIFVNRFNETLKCRIAKLENRNSNVEGKLNELELRLQAERYIYAIQDLNSLEELEKNIPAHSKKLRRLRSGRYAPVRFIYDDDNDKVVQAKIKFTLLKLRSIPDPLRDHIERLYGGGIITGIYNYMMTKFSEHEVIDVSLDSEDAAWWEF
eukprot:scaffold51_cov172-Ochromonas_danica.AAC.14